MIRSGFRRLLSLAVGVALCASLAVPGFGQSNNAWMQQQRMQQQQQQMQRQQQQARQAQQAADAARRAQQAADQARRAGDQARRAGDAANRAAAAQRANNSASQNRRDAFNRQGGVTTPANGNAKSYGTNAYKPGTAAGGAGRPSASTGIKGPPNRNVSANEGRGFVSSAGVTKLTRPLTPGEIKKGFTGRFTGDGRALVRFQGRVFAVPAGGLSRLIRRPANQNVQASRWSQQQKLAMVSRAQALAIRTRANAAGSSGRGGPPSNLAGLRGNAAKLVAARAQSEAKGLPTQTSPRQVTTTTVQARKRSAAMAKSGKGYNISPVSWDRFDKLGKERTYLTDREAIDSILAKAKLMAGRYTVSRQDAANIEREFGLEFGSLKDGFKIREVSGINELNLAPAEDGNRYYRGAGRHLPGGHPELTVESVQTNGDNVSVINEIFIES